MASTFIHLPVKVDNTTGSSLDNDGLETTVTSVSTSAVQLNISDAVYNYTIFHQTEDALVYWGNDSSVQASTDFPHLKNNDVLIIEAAKDFEIWMITSTGTVKVFVTSTLKQG